MPCWLRVTGRVGAGGGLEAGWVAVVGWAVGKTGPEGEQGTTEASEGVGAGRWASKGEEGRGAGRRASEGEEWGTGPGEEELGTGPGEEGIWGPAVGERGWASWEGRLRVWRMAGERPSWRKSYVCV